MCALRPARSQPCESSVAPLRMQAAFRLVPGLSAELAAVAATISGNLTQVGAGCSGQGSHYSAGLLLAAPWAQCTFMHAWAQCMFMHA